MGTDLEALDEIFSQPVEKKARAGVKFQPKAKPHPRKESSAIPSIQSIHAVDITEDEKFSALVGPSLVSSEFPKTEKSLKTNENFVSGLHSPDDCAVVNHSLEHVLIGETLGSSATLHFDVLRGVNGDLHFTTEKSAGESAENFLGLESLDDLYFQSTTSTVLDANRSPKEVDLSVRVGNDLSTSCPVHNDAEDFLAHSEILTVDASDNRSIEEEAVVPVLSPLDVSAVRISNATSSYPSPKLTVAQDSLNTRCGGYHINTRCLEIEEAEVIPYFETLDNLFDLTTKSGHRARREKFQPKPKAQIDREKPDSNTSHPEGNKSVPCSHDAHYVPSESEYLNEASISAFPSNDLLDISSLQFGDTASRIPEIEEPLNPVETKEKVSPSTKSRKKKRPRVPVDSSEHQQASISGQENEADNDKNFMSNNSAPQKEKPVRKRKNADEVSDQATKVPPKKFSHSTRRKGRQVDKALLETPEDEIDVTKLRIRDLILLAEHRERISSKEGKISEVPSTNNSVGPSSVGYNEDQASAVEQGDFSDDQTNPVVQESSIYTNYQTYMKRTPRSRWSKRDTELFYEALRQFGSDISMVQQLFPGRSRAQVKLKYKKEERQHPLRLHEALTTRSEDHSHFQLVIDHLKEIAAQEKENACRDDSAALSNDEEEVNPEINEEIAKPEQAGEGEEVENPTKSGDSEDDDDLFRWSQYKSQL